MPQAWQNFQNILLLFQHMVSMIGVIIIITGVLLALYQYLHYIIIHQLIGQESKINEIRLNLGRILILGLEFIVAADLISTTTTPDYYTLGIVASIVIIRTFLSFSLSQEMSSLNKENMVKKNNKNSHQEHIECQ